MLDKVDQSLKFAHVALKKRDGKSLASHIPFIRAFGDARRIAEADAIKAASVGQWKDCLKILMQLAASGLLSEGSVVLLIQALAEEGEANRAKEFAKSVLRQPNISVNLLVELTEWMLLNGDIGDFRQARDRLLEGDSPKQSELLGKALDWGLRTKSREDFYVAFDALPAEQRFRRDSQLKRFQIEAECGSNVIAEEILNGLLRANPDDYVANSFLIRLLLDTNRHVESLRLLEKYHLDDLRTDPFMLESYFGALMRAERYQQVADESRSLIDSSDVTVKYIAARSLAESEFKLGDLRAALSLKERMEAASQTLGIDDSLFWAVIYSTVGDRDAADRLFSAAVCGPDSTPEAHYEYSIHLLRGGRHQEAWPHYTYRFRALTALKKFARYDDLLSLSGTRLQSSRKIHIYPEQGLGDQLLFLRYIPKVAQLGYEVTLHIEPRMKDILSLCPAMDGISKEDLNMPPPLDSIGGEEKMVIPVGDVPLLLSRLNVISEMPQPLRIDQTRLPGALLPDGPKKVGLAWRGASNTNAKLKSVPFTDIERLIRGLEDCEFLNCNYLAETAADISESGLLEKFCEPSPLPESDLIGTLSRLNSCDVIVSTSQTYVHLAIMLGKPTLVLLPNPTAELWYWASIAGFSNHSDCVDLTSVLRFNLLTDGTPLNAIKQWIKKPAH